MYTPQNRGDVPVRSRASELAELRQRALKPSAMVIAAILMVRHKLDPLQRNSTLRRLKFVRSNGVKIASPQRAQFSSVCRRSALPQPPARMREQEIDATRLRSEIGLHHAAVRVGLLGIAQQPLKIAHIAIDIGPEFAVAVVAPADFVERRLPVGAVEMPSQHAALTGAEALPDLRRRARVDGARDLIDPQALGTGDLRRAAEPLIAIGRRFRFGRTRQKIADRPALFAPAVARAVVDLAGEGTCATSPGRRAGQLLRQAVRDRADILLWRISLLPLGIEAGQRR